MSLRFVIIGGGPAGTQAATYAAPLGAEVTLIERDIVGGAANLWDCVPSKAMIATGGALDDDQRGRGHGPAASSPRRSTSTRSATASRHRRQARGSNRRAAREPGRHARRGHRSTRRRPHGASPRPTDGEHRRSRPTRSSSSTGQPAPDPGLGHARRRPGAHHPRRLPAEGDARAPGRDRLRRHRRRVRPHVLELRLEGHADGVAASRCCRRRTPRSRRCSRTTSCGVGCKLFKGARADRARARPTTASSCAATTAGRPRAATRCSPSGRCPTPKASDSTPPASRWTGRGSRTLDHHLRTNVAAHLRRRRPVREAAAVVGRGDAGPQDRRARDGPAQGRPPPPRLREGGLGDLHRSRDRGRRPGRGRRVRRGPQGPGDEGAVRDDRRRR